MKRVRLALFGLGTVGLEFFRLFEQHRPELAGVDVDLKLIGVCDRDESRFFGLGLTERQIFTNAERLMEQDFDIAVELLGGVELPFNLVLKSLGKGISFVTANKAMLAARPEIFNLTAISPGSLRFSAAVLGSTPCLQLLETRRFADRLESVTAILNGTSNFIISAMRNEGLTFATAVAKAQSLGYAETPPDLDVEGWDSLHKLMVILLSQGIAVEMSEITPQGITAIRPEDFSYATMVGCSIRPIAFAQINHQDRQVNAWVSPALVSQHSNLAKTDGVINRAEFVFERAKLIDIGGLGAGPQTAVDVWSDVCQLAVGNHDFSWKSRPVVYTLTPSDQLRSQHYLRFVVDDRVGLLADITGSLAQADISLNAVHQHPDFETDGSNLPFVIITHPTSPAQLNVAIMAMENNPNLRQHFRQPPLILPFLESK